MFPAWQSLWQLFPTHKKTKTKAKHKEWKRRQLHSLLHPVLEKSQQSSLSSLKSAVLPDTRRTTPSPEGSECPRASLTAFQDVRAGSTVKVFPRYTRTSWTCIEKPGFEKKALWSGGRKMTIKVSGLAYLSIPHPDLQKFLFFWKAKLRDHSPRDFGGVQDKQACTCSCDSSALQKQWSRSYYRIPLQIWSPDPPGS